MDFLVYCSNSLPSSSLQRKINALTEKTRVFLNNQEMMAAMMEGMPLRQLLSLFPELKKNAGTDGWCFKRRRCIYKKNISMEMKALCQIRK